MLSVIMPVYNEVGTLSQIIQKVLDVPIEKELIIVDDGSSDGSRDILKALDDQRIKVVYHEKNQGKGAAIRTGQAHVTGDIVIIQDADLETEPNDYLHLVKPIQEGKTAVVFGSRILGLDKAYNKTYYLGGKFVTAIANLLYGQGITDEPTCYKVMSSDLFKSIEIESNGFEFCPEITAKVSRMGHQIVELPMRYYPRSTNEGKKLRWTDGFKAIWTLFKYRFGRISKG
ncbi:MAG: glycosyltransferase family 2 protein [Bacteroidia bacterium]|nr:glycosyltransferase family 2 protein [Bacteroidia bacterium]